MTKTAIYKKFGKQLYKLKVYSVIQKVSQIKHALQKKTVNKNTYIILLTSSIPMKLTVFLAVTIIQSFYRVSNRLISPSIPHHRKDNVTVFTMPHMSDSYEKFLNYLVTYL